VTARSSWTAGATGADFRAEPGGEGPAGGLPVTGHGPVAREIVRLPAGPFRPQLHDRRTGGAALRTRPARRLERGISAVSLAPDRDSRCRRRRAASDRV